MSDVTVRQLRCFVAVYSERSFTRAAKALGMAQSAVSQAVGSLEAHLDAQLFERGPRDVAPTPAADAIYPESLEIRRRVEALLHIAATAQDLPRARRLRMGAASSVFPTLGQRLIPALSGFSLDVVDGGSAQLTAALENGDLDLVLVRDVTHDADDRRIVLRERFCVAVPEGHAFAAAESLTVAELADEPLVLFDRERAPVAFDLTTSVFLRAGSALRIASRVASEQAMLGLVGAGLGVSLIPESVAERPWPGVAFVPLAGAEADYPLCARVAPGDPLGLLDLVADAFA
ncbi:LysR family transcriptional regulator [Microbacterium indicum]|uniref:LysR family transcriptional regulator n=1 Tax=Microbacterium indicum TaxID=358100 RepID=UPI00041C8FAA|nr:LysR family transcriptional regulator [Microbacterium indicum]